MPIAQVLYTTHYIHVVSWFIHNMYYTLCTGSVMVYTHVLVLCNVWASCQDLQTILMDSANIDGCSQLVRKPKYILATRLVSYQYQQSTSPDLTWSLLWAGDQDKYWLSIGPHNKMPVSTINISRPNVIIAFSWSPRNAFFLRLAHTTSCQHLQTIQMDPLPMLITQERQLLKGWVEE